MDSVSKKFRKGELYDSLRDFMPGAGAAGWRPRSCRRAGDAGVLGAARRVVRRRAGEAFGIIGANGAGKSTILKILSRHHDARPRRHDGATAGSRALIEVGAGFHPDLTGRENIYLNGTILGMTRAEIRRKFDEIVEFSGLEEFIDTPVKRYSSGMFARLGFSVAAHVDPGRPDRGRGAERRRLHVPDTSARRRCTPSWAAARP